MPVFRETARRMPGVKKILAVPPFVGDETLKAWYGDVSDFKIVRDSHQAVARAHSAFVCSGTATLETALIGTPFTLVYKTRPLDYKIGRMFVKLPHVGLANIILDFAGEPPLHPELFQQAVTPERLLKLYETGDDTAFAEGRERLMGILKHGSAERVAAMVSD
jgi:lipid-A-disaccharide synthase